MPSYFVWPHFCRRNKRGVVIVYDSSVAREQAFPEQPIEKW